MATALVPARCSHRELLSPVPFGYAAPDAIVVSATRRAAGLRETAEVAAKLGSLAVVLCSRSATAADFGHLAARIPNLRWLAVDLPAGYRHPLFDFATSRIEEAKAARLGDLSMKRNLGLVLAKLAGWRRLMFLDDDIAGLVPAQLRRAAAALGPLDMVGLEVRDFPDNSVVCHANRLAGAKQDTFVSGSALLVDANRVYSFFPEIYNEDWLFLSPSVRRRRVGRTGSVRQLPYDPFARPSRAVGEEFGDVFAEGLMELAHSLLPQETAGTPEFWDRFLDGRRQLIAETADGIACGDPTITALEAAIALEAAEARRASIDARALSVYLHTWHEDLAVWRSRLGDLCATSLTTALDSLDLSAVGETRERKTHGRLRGRTDRQQRHSRVNRRNRRPLPAPAGR